jgi:hypothetical protein
MVMVRTSGAKLTSTILRPLSNKRLKLAARVD